MLIHNTEIKLHVTTHGLTKYLDGVDPTSKIDFQRGHGTAD